MISKMGRTLFYNWPSPQSDRYWTSSLGGLDIFVIIAIIVALLSWSQRWGGPSFTIGPLLRVIAIEHPHGESFSSLLWYEREACFIFSALPRVVAIKRPCRDLVIFSSLSYSVLYIVCVFFRSADINQFHASSKSYFCNLNQYAQCNKSRQFKQYCQTRQNKWYIIRQFLSIIPTNQPCPVSL